MENNLVIKEVNFNGAMLLAAQENNSNKVYVGIKWVSEGIGLTIGQFQSQTRKIQEDLVLSKGIANLQLPTNGGIQEVLCIELDFLPLWLAKIAITPNMKDNNPEVVEKLINYQLKAKEVLAEAFVRNKAPQNYKEALLALIEREEELELLRPKGEQYDVFLSAKNSLSMLEVSKSLNVGRNKLFRFLRFKQILMKNNIPYQRYIDQKLFKTRQVIRTKKNGMTYTISQTLVTTKGISWICQFLQDLKKNKSLLLEQTDTPDLKQIS